MFKKQWVQQVGIGILIWVIGSAIWDWISGGFHLPALNWSAIGYLAQVVFFIFMYTVAVPFATGSLNLYFARKNLEFQREQLEFGVPTFFPPKIPAKAPGRSGRGLNNADSSGV
jgi:hypothetical protein